MQELIEHLARELERPRNVTEQITKHLADAHEVSRDQVGAFLTGGIAALEDYEVDLALAPLFTPVLRDQAVFALLLGGEKIPKTQWPALVAQLVARPTLARLVTADGVQHPVPLREVSIERYVHRLRLDGEIHADVAPLLASISDEQVRALTSGIARRAVWENPKHREVLIRYLARADAMAACFAQDVESLLKLVETYQPANVAELLAQIPHWQNVLREELNSGGGARPFFNERVEELHGGGRDQRRQDNSRQRARQEESEMLERLKITLQPP